MTDDANAKRWPVVTRDRPCPKCGKGDRCTLAPDGRAGRCWRDDGGTTWRDKAAPNERPARTLRTPGPGTNVKPKRVYPTLAAAVTAARLMIPNARLYGEPWVYRDAAGAPLMAVARFDLPGGSKTCRPFSPAPNGGWALGDPDGPLLPLYGLDALAAAGPATRVYVCEGERCVDALRSIGLLAVTSSHGAASAGKTDWSPLAGRAEVVILPDRDPAGERYRADVNGLLFRLLRPPTRVAVVRLEHPRGDATPDGFDVADWVELRDGDEPAALAAALDAMADAAPPEPAPAIGESLTGGPAAAASADRRPAPRPTPWQPFPLDALPPAVRRFVSNVAGARGVEPAMLAVPVLAVLSAAIGNARRLRLKRDYFVPAVLWPTLVAESGGGKSPAIDAALAPVRDLQLRAHREHQAALAEHAKAVADWKAGGKEGDPPAPPEPMRHFFVEDVTAEGLAARLADNPRGVLLARDEQAAWFKSWGAYKGGRGGDREAFLGFYDARMVKVDRKAADGGPRTLIVPHAFVAVTGGIQPAILRGIFADPELSHCGMVARLLLAMPPERQMLWSDDEPDEDAIDGYARVVGELSLLDFDPAAAPGVVGLTDAARAAHRDWFDRMERARTAAADADERAAIPKLRAAAARIALVLHMAAAVEGEPGIDPTRVDERSMRAGIAVAEWFANENRRVRAMLAGGEHHDRLLRRLRAIADAGGGSVPGTVTVREWDKRRRIGTDVARAELRELADAGLGTLAYESTGGRQAERFRPHPIAVDPADDEDEAATGDNAADAA